MSDSKLGKGLSAIFGENIDTILDDIQQGNVDGMKETSTIEVKLIRPNPYQPRKEFDKEKLKELSQSIATHGVFTPILVKKSVSGYELVAGERRLRAAKLAKLKEIPAIVVDFDDKQMMEISLLENIQRENLNVMEEAHAYANLCEKLGYTQEKLAKQIGKSREYVANILRLLKLPTSIQTLVQEQKLSMGHVRALLALEDEETMLYIATIAMDEKLSVRQVEKMVKDTKNPYIKKNKPDIKNETEYQFVIDTLQTKLQTKVSVDEHQIVIKYADTDDLNRILEAMDCLDKS